LKIAVGLLGGTFDPIHNGHLQLAEAAKSSCGMVRVFLIPAALPPHKKQEAVSAGDHRLAMLRETLVDHESIDVCTVEMDRNGPSYTFDTLKQFKDEYEAKFELYFIIGCDAFLEIETWYRWQDLLRSTNFIVAVRKHYNLSDVKALLSRNGLKECLETGLRWQGTANHILLLDTSIDDISSTEVRRRIRSGQSWRHLVPEKVSAYIDRHGLYL